MFHCQGNHSTGRGTQPRHTFGVGVQKQYSVSLLQPQALLFVLKSKFNPTDSTGSWAQTTLPKPSAVGMRQERASTQLLLHLCKNACQQMPAWKSWFGDTEHRAHLVSLQLLGTVFVYHQTDPGWFSHSTDAIHEETLLPFGHPSCYTVFQQKAASPSAQLSSREDVGLGPACCAIR